MTREATRHVLFLQGLPGSSMRRLARELGRAGMRTSKINFNGGDWFDWRLSGSCYRGRMEAFAPWLADHCTREAVDAVVLFGEFRFLHEAAAAVCARFGINLFHMEEGYLRPYSVALEFWPGARRWPSPATLRDCDTMASGLDTGFDPEEFPAHLRRRVREAIVYWVATTVCHPLFPHFRSHRPHTSAAELWLWLRRLVRRPGEQAASRAALEQLGSEPFVLLPLQLDGDAAIAVRSPFSDMGEAAACIIGEFAAHAPPGLHLVVKRHPYDPAERDWRRLIGELAARLGVADRVHVVEFADLDRLLDTCRGVVTVNSTVGQLAVARGRATRALGRALYALPGLTDQRSAAAFWAAPQVPSPDAYRRLSRALWAECLVNGGFHSKAGLDLFARNAAARIVGALQ